VQSPPPAYTGDYMLTKVGFILSDKLLFRDGC
jgi:hypothetical protein